ARRVERFAVEALAHGAHRVALRGLDLDHLGAEIGQQPPAERARDGRSHLEHSMSGERPARLALRLLHLWSLRVHRVHSAATPGRPSTDLFTGMLTLFRRRVYGAVWL